MPCPYHRSLCAFPEWSVELCEFCHAPWSKILAPAARLIGTRITKRKGVEEIVNEYAWLHGYGETALSHLWRHAADEARATANAAKRRAA